MASDDDSICHRDIKPENLLLDENYQLKIADFGLSASCVSLLKQTCGTKEFAAPGMSTERFLR